MGHLLVVASSTPLYVDVQQNPHVHPPFNRGERMSRRTLTLLAACIAATLLASSTRSQQMTVGTNVWYPGWGGGTADPFAGGYTNVTGDNPWKPAFIEEVSHYTAIRFMDLGGLNSHSDGDWDCPASWADRTPKSAQYQMPVAYEWMIDMCNRAGTDMWICIPYYWDVDLPGCRSLAQLIHSTLDGDLKVYVEYGNENWSTGYNQDYCRQRGVAEGLGTELDQITGDRYSAYASLRIWEEFEDVFGSNSPRLVRVLSGWDVSAMTTSRQLGFLVVDTVRNPNHTLPDLYCVAPYNNKGSIAAAYEGLADVARNLRSHNSVLARAGNIPLGCYEGGFGDENHETMAGDPAVYALTKAYLDTLNAYTGGVFNHLNHSCSRWGAKMYIGEPLEDAHIYRALIDWNADHPVGVSHSPSHQQHLVIVESAQCLPRQFTLDGRLSGLMTGERAIARATYVTWPKTGHAGITELRIR